MDRQLLVTVRYSLRPGTRDEFYQKVCEAGIIEASRGEPGNLKYDCYLPLDSEDALCLLELWESEAAQRAHGATAHYARLGELKARYVLNAAITKYHIER